MYEKDTGNYYIKARYYDPAVGRWLSPDTHWNVGNMIYGDNPQDPLGLNIYTPDIHAIMQSDLDLRKTGIEMVVNCPKCGRKDYATPGSSIMHDEIPHIIKSTWKGYDVFYTEAFGNTIFCTERFIEIYNQSKMTGLVFEQIPTV